MLRVYLPVALTAAGLSFGCSGYDEPPPAGHYGYGGSTPDPTATESDNATAAPLPSAGAGGSGARDIAWSAWGGGDAYLADSQDRTLYLFANDIPYANTSACTGGCLDSWPVWDARTPRLGDNLDDADFGRFQREDGSWQSTYKGRPLYRFANDSDRNRLAGDGAGGRWYAARDYFVFYASDGDTAPRGNGELGSPFLTNRAGRTLYIFENDRPGAAGRAESACEEGCLQAWPAWYAPADMSNLIVPSDLDPTDLEWFSRDDGSRQVTYHGWPLYYFAQDDLAGEVEGHTVDNWTTIDTGSFNNASSGGGGGGGGGGGYDY